MIEVVAINPRGWPVGYTQIEPSGVVEYRYNNVWGYYEVRTRDNDTWRELRNTSDIVDVLEDSPNAEQYFDDTYEYCEQ